MNYQKRLEYVCEEMEQRNIGLLFLNTNATNLFYVAGIPRTPPKPTDLETYGDSICGAFIGSDGMFILLVPYLAVDFFKNEANSKPWIKDIRSISPGDRPEDILMSILKQFLLKLLQQRLR